MKKSVIGLFIFVFLIFLYWYNRSGVNLSLRNDQDFVVGIASGYLPFVGLDRAGNYEGFDIDVAQSLADHLNKKLVLKDCGSMSSLFIALEQGLVDGIMWGLSITESRLQKVAMIRYYGDDVCSYPLVFYNSFLSIGASLDDYADKTICVEAGSVQEKMLNQYPLIKKLTVDRVDDALFALQYNKADGALVESAIAKKFKVLFPNEISIVNVSLKKDECERGIGIAIRKQNEKLINEVEDAISCMCKSGIIDQYAKKWGL